MSARGYALYSACPNFRFFSFNSGGDGLVRSISMIWPHLLGILIRHCYWTGRSLGTEAAATPFQAKGRSYDHEVEQIMSSVLKSL